MPAQIGYYDTLKSVAGKIFSYLASITLTGTDGKTLTVEDNSLVNQDLTSDASPTHVTVKLTGLTDGKIPYHVSDATGLADSPINTDGSAKVGIVRTDPIDGLNISIDYPKTEATNKGVLRLYSNEAYLANPAGMNINIVGGASQGVRWVELQTDEYNVANDGNIILEPYGGNVFVGTVDIDGTPAVGRLTIKGTTSDGSTLIFVGRDSIEANVITVDTDGDVLNSAGVYGTISDEKLKENIQDATDKLSDLLRVKVRHFNLKDKPNLKQLGIVAQELESVFPGLVTSTPDMERVPDPDWTPKTLKRQMTEIIKVEKQKTEIVEVDGKYVQETIIEIAEETIRLFDEVPLYNESGEMLMQVLHKIPRMEEYTESESDRPMIVRPTGTVTKAVKTSVFIPILIKAVQELTVRVQKLETK